MEAFFHEDFKEEDQPVDILLTTGCIRTLPGSEAPWFYPSQDDLAGFKVMAFVYSTLPQNGAFIFLKPFVDKKGGVGGKQACFLSFHQTCN